MNLDGAMISSRSNPLVRQVRALRSRKGREKTGLFLVEGIHHVGEAVEAGWEIEALLYASELLSSDFARGLIEQQAGRGVRCQPVTAEVLESLADKENPQGILTVVRQRSWRLDDLTPRNFRWGAAAVAPQDPGNVGAILRTLDAVGADGLFLLDGGADPYHPSSMRASMGTLFWKPVVQASFEEFVRWAQRHGYWLVASSAHAQSDYRSLKRGGRPMILVLGSEQKGLAPEQLAACDLAAALPMRGQASSLNLAVAAGILLYTLGDEK